MLSGWRKLICVLPCLFICAELVEASAPDAIPYYPGGQVEMEALLTRDDLLGFALDGSSSEALSPLDGLLTRVTGLQVLRMAIASPVDQLQVIGFYSRIPQSAGMSRIFKRYDPAGGVVLVWCGPGGNGMFGLQLVRGDAGRGEPARWTLQVARLRGVVDVQAVLKELNSEGA